MRNKTKYWYIIIAFIVLAATWYVYAEYNRKPADLSLVKSLASVSDLQIVTMYAQDEQKANELYLGKPIDVEGIVSEINNQSDTIVNIMLGKLGDLHRVSCLMDVNHVDIIKDYKPGDKITLRGICTGYLIDVELNRCVVIK